MKATGMTRAMGVWGIVVIVALAGLVFTLQWVRAEGHAKEAARLPKAAAAGIRAAFPGAKIREVEREKKELVIYEVELIRDGREIEVEVSADGVILAVEQEMAASALPKPVADAVARLAKGGKVEEVELKEVRARLTVVPLPMPQTVYEVEIESKDGETFEVELDAAGNVLKSEADDHEHEHEGHN